MLNIPADHSAKQRRRGLALIAMACSLAMAGCMGSWAIRGTRLHYNESFSHTSSQEMLLNIVRMRYGETPTFLDLPSINNVSEANVVGNGAQPADSVTQGIFGGDFGLCDEPTLGYQPRRGDNLAESLVKHLKAETLLDIPPGNDTRTFLLTFVDSMNGVRNSPTATSLGSRVLEPNDDYRHAIDLFMGLQNRGAVKFRVAKRDDETHGPVPDAKVMGNDAVMAAEEGYVYQSSDDQVTLLKCGRFLAMAIKPEEVGVADLAELTEMLQLVPSRTAYVIKSQEDVEVDLNDEAAASMLPSGPVEEVSMNVRSGYQAMAFLAKGVTVPPAHVRRGEVHTYKALDGRPFDARHLTRGLFSVCVQKHRPLHSDLAVHYRGHWFYIAENDVQSRATLTLLKFIIDVNSQSGAAGPVLTLPLR
jgi:hypothetical protein